tara:strand:- start:1314 stop:2180 length:867 start_codon:yes stop_codon:yes gene_type:complete
MPVELPYVNDSVQKPVEPVQPVRKPETEIFTKPNMELEITPTGFPQTNKPPDAIPLIKEEKKKGKPRGVKDPEARKAHMEKMRKASADSRARKKAEKIKSKQGLPTIPEGRPLIQVTETPQLIPNPPPTTPVNNPVHSQPVEADLLRKKLEELQTQNNAYKSWYTENKHHLDKIPVTVGGHSVSGANQGVSGANQGIQHQKPAEYKNINQQQMNMNAGFDRLNSLEKMIRKDEREKVIEQQKIEREEQAKNLRTNVRMPKGLQKWQSVNTSKTYKTNEDMWADCFNPR